MRIRTAYAKVHPPAHTDSRARTTRQGLVRLQERWTGCTPEDVVKAPKVGIQRRAAVRALETAGGVPAALAGVALVCKNRRDARTSNIPYTEC